LPWGRDEVARWLPATQDSTREIRDMIGTLQQGAGNAANVMEDSREIGTKNPSSNSAGGGRAETDQA